MISVQKLTTIVHNLWSVANDRLHKSLNILYVKEEIRRNNTKYVVCQ